MDETKDPKKLRKCPACQPPLFCGACQDTGLSPLIQLVAPFRGPFNFHWSYTLKGYVLRVGKRLVALDDHRRVAAKPEPDQAEEEARNSATARGLRGGMAAERYKTLPEQAPLDDIRSARLPGVTASQWRRHGSYVTDGHYRGWIRELTEPVVYFDHRDLTADAPEGVRRVPVAEPHARAEFWGDAVIFDTPGSDWIGAGLEPKPRGRSIENGRRSPDGRPLLPAALRFPDDDPYLGDFVTGPRDKQLLQAPGDVLARGQVMVLTGRASSDGRWQHEGDLDGWMKGEDSISLAWRDGLINWPRLEPRRCLISVPDLPVTPDDLTPEQERIAALMEEPRGGLNYGRHKPVTEHRSQDEHQKSARASLDYDVSRDMRDSGVVYTVVEKGPTGFPVGRPKIEVPPEAQVRDDFGWTREDFDALTKRRDRRQRGGVDALRRRQLVAQIAWWYAEPHPAGAVKALAQAYGVTPRRLRELRDEGQAEVAPLNPQDGARARGQSFGNRLEVAPLNPQDGEAAKV